MFDPKSRYRRQEPYETRDRLGRMVVVIPPPEAPAQSLLGHHLRRHGQRLEHLAARYLDDPAGAWRLWELAGVVYPEALSEAVEIAIPVKGS